MIGLAAPANGSHTSDATPALSGTAGIAAGDSSTVTVRVYSGTGTSGTLAQTRSATRNGSTGAYSVDAGALPGHLHGAGLAARLGREQRIQRRQHVHHRRPAADRHAGPHLAGRLGGADRVGLDQRQLQRRRPGLRPAERGPWRGRRAAPTRRLPRTALRAPRAPSSTARQPATAPMTSTPAPGTTRTTTRRLPLRPIRRRNSTRPLRIRRSTRGPPAQARTAGRPRLPRERAGLELPLLAQRRRPRLRPLLGPRRQRHPWGAARRRRLHLRGSGNRSARERGSDPRGALLHRPDAAAGDPPAQPPAEEDPDRAGLDQGQVRLLLTGHGVELSLQARPRRLRALHLPAALPGPPGPAPLHGRGRRPGGPRSVPGPLCLHRAAPARPPLRGRV